MCSHSEPKIEAAKPPAPTVAAPDPVEKQSTIETTGEQKKRKAKGKKALMVDSKSAGAGLNM